MEQTGARRLIESLLAEGIDTMFGIPGVATLGVYDALVDYPELRAINVRHEQAAIFMADGYARASGKVAAAFTSGGPGALNTLTAMSTAYTDSSPVLHVFNENPAHVRRRDRGYFHDISDQFGMFRPVSGFGVQVMRADEIPVAIHGAMDALRNRRPRPAVVEITPEALEGTTGVEPLPPAQHFPRAAPRGEIAAAVDRISTARRPVVWSGGGVIASGAARELRELAELLGAPVLTSQAGKGSFPADHPLHVGNWANEQPVRDLLEDSDLLIAVGTRFSYFPTGGWSLDLSLPIVQLDIDPAGIGRNYPVAAAVVGDARQSLAGILAALRQQGVAGLASRAGDVASVHRRIRRAVGDHVELDVLDQIRQALPHGARVFNDPTTIAFWARSAWPAYEPRTWFVPSGFGTLGFALPAAIGGAIANPDEPSVAIIGDAGIMFTVQDLMTAVQERVPVIVLVFNDEGYGVERRHQEELFGRHSGVDITPPDFVALAQAFGARGLLVEDLDKVGAAVESVLGTDGPVVIEVPNTFAHPGYGAWALYD